MTLRSIDGAQDKGAENSRLQWPAPERNKDAILEVLVNHIFHTPRQIQKCLEIGAGSGQHAAYFAAKLPDTVWQATDPDPRHVTSIQAWFDLAGLKNTPAPVLLDTRERPWPIRNADAIFCINMIHISPPESFISLFDEATSILSKGGIVYLYGPFSIGGHQVARSNIDFDNKLKAQDPRWGIRDLNEVSTTAKKYGFHLVKTIEMPANNLSVIFKSGR